MTIKEINSAKKQQKAKKVYKLQLLSYVCKVSQALLNIKPLLSSLFSAGQQVVLKVVLLVALALILVAIPHTVFAGDFDNNPLSYAPPQLDQQQATRWINSLPWARVYLARLWDISQPVAEAYGAEYKSPTCGLALLSGKSPSFPTDTGAGAKWDVVFKPIEQFKPVPVPIYAYPKPTPIVVKYDAPPSLSTVEQNRWGQALPWAKVYLARLWGISKEEAEKYGAKYE